FNFDQNSIDLKQIKKINIVACGTSYYAGLVAKQWGQQLAQISVEVHLGSEYRYSNPVIDDNELFIFISQSGETADTITCAKMVKELGHLSIGVINTKESSLSRICSDVILNNAGPEIGVASTKAFTAQLMVLYLFILNLAKERGVLGQDKFEQCLNIIKQLPTKIDYLLQDVESIKTVAAKLKESSNLLYLARGILSPIASEAALKIKEVSYIHAEGMPAGEMKHGVIALIDKTWPVLFLAPHGDPLFEKVVSNMQEVQARDGQLMVITDQAGSKYLKQQFQDISILVMPSAESLLNPFLTVVISQLLAYYTALALGTDIDCPRNLAKSVTVE
ncbi:MAG: isomerizing glutamine--fructose-6-phosphate transaminase, partial [Pseudomonadota bacterium]